jgi:hypothetical protein
MGFLFGKKQNGKKAQTRIIKHKLEPAPVKLRCDAPTSSTRWEPQSRVFEGFDSPPGRF